MRNVENGVLDDVLPVAEFSRKFPHLGSEASLRWQIFCAEQNGLADSGAICRRGARVFILVPNYFSWLTGKTGQAA